jgi:acyl-CoA synthetase (AMP-forming)/AMP-acid ligase II
MLIGDLAHRGAQLWGDRVAFTWESRTRTYTEVADRTARLASVLADAGVEEGTRIATLSTNDPDVIELCFAASLPGAVVVPLNVRLLGDELRFQIEDAGVTHGLVHPSLAGLAEDSGVAARHAWFLGSSTRSSRPLIRGRRRRPARPMTAPSSTCTRRVRQDSRRAACSRSAPGWPRTPTWPTPWASARTTACSPCSHSPTSPASVSPSRISRWVPES